MKFKLIFTFIFLILSGFFAANSSLAMIDECNMSCSIESGSGCGYCSQDYSRGCVVYSWRDYATGDEVMGPWCDPICNSNLTSDCFLRCNPCWNYTTCRGTPPTATPQPTSPPPPPGGSCDSSCINQCGYRNSNGSCTTNNACCHRTCSNRSCVTVAGGGSNTCNDDNQCRPDNPPQCNTISMAYNPSPGHIGQSINFQITSGDASTYIDDFYSGGVTNCHGSWNSKTCNVTASGTYRWTHQWRHCEGDTDLAHCSVICQQFIDFTVADNPPPACDSNQLTMSVNPNPVQAGQNLTFSLSGSQGSSSPYDTFSGGVNCGNGGFWPNKTCNATTPGTYTWTHYWQNCVGVNCTPQCSKQMNFTVTNPNTDFNGIVFDPNNNRWTAGGGGCASRQGLTVSSSLGSLAWRSDYFDVNSATANQTVVVTLNPPTQCHYMCDRWATSDGSTSGSGCTAIFNTTQPSWSRNVYFYMKPNCVGSCSAPYCGQSDGCLGVCTSSDSLPPSPTTIIYPNGTITAPIVYPTSGNVDFSWVKSTDTLTDGYVLGIFNASNTLIASHTINDINTVNFSLPITGNFNPGQVYHWEIRTLNNTCNGVGGNVTNYSSWSSAGYFKINFPPTITSFILENNNGTAVSSENIAGVGSSVNHICDPRFVNSRTVKIVVNATDSDGLNDIQTIQLQVGSHTYTDNSVTGGQSTFTVSDLTDSSTLYTIKAIATDKKGSSSPLTDSGRLLKMWNCLVPISGTFYDGSAAVFGAINCANSSNDFTNRMPSSVNWTSLRFTDKNMDVHPADSNYNHSPGNELIWGKNYIPVFNPDISSTEPKMRSPNSSVCQGSFTISNINIPGGDVVIVDPYSNSPSLVIDFSAILNQEPWFQVTAGGINSINVAKDYIPPTCQYEEDCTPAATINNPLFNNSNNGLVISETADMGKGQFGNPNNWSYSTSRSSLSEDYNFNNYLQSYNANHLLAKYYDHDVNFDFIISDNGTTGVVLVDGTVTINQENTLADNKFLMIIAHNNIVIDNNVNKISGIFMADGTITAGGKSDTPLEVYGSLYSSSSTVSLTRDFNTKSLNNSKPAVVVNFSPHLIFFLPEIISGHSQLHKYGI